MKTNCIDTNVLLSCFNENHQRILEIGSHDESPAAAVEFARRGCSVTAVDLREPECPHANKLYEFIRGDFCNLPDKWMKENIGTFDAVYSISAIEHFGLNAYLEGPLNLSYDVVAMRLAWMLLREGGTAYISVPYGRMHLTLTPRWRVYNARSLNERIVQDFTVDRHIFFFSVETEFNGRLAKKGEWITPQEAQTYGGEPPHLTVFLKMTKRSKKRLSPDGSYSSWFQK